MQRRSILLPLFAAAVILGSGLSGWLFGAEVAVPIRQSIAAMAEPERPVHEPSRLRIDRIGIDAPVEPVGATADGTMDIPRDWRNGGWYKPGPKPGERGNAVIAGHLDSQTGPAVFWRLKDLEKGDEVIVTDAAGVERAFTVVGVELYDAEAAPLERIFGDAWGAYLNLITCDGDWKDGEGYSDRLVVFTKYKETIDTDELAAAPRIK
jgi:sortase A